MNLYMQSLGIHSKHENLQGKFGTQTQGKRHQAARTSNYDGVVNVDTNIGSKLIRISLSNYTLS